MRSPTWEPRSGGEQSDRLTVEVVRVEEGGCCFPSEAMLPPSGSSLSGPIRAPSRAEEKSWSMLSVQPSSTTPNPTFLKSWTNNGSDPIRYPLKLMHIHK